MPGDLRRQRDPAPLGVGPPEYRNVADALHEFGARLVAEGTDHRVPAVASAGADTDFQQLVVVQRGIQLRQQARGQARAAGEKHRLQVMSEATQVLFLSFIQWHMCGS